MRAFKKLYSVVISPAFIAILLVNGILLGFGVAHILKISWHQIYTIIFYCVVSIFGARLIFRDVFNLKITTIDVFYCVFATAVLASSAINFWPGTTKYLLYTPVFMFLPYILGRLMTEFEVLKLKVMLLIYGTLIIFMTPYEYVNMQLPFPDWPVPVIFGQSHGVMLAGLILCPMLLVIVSKIIFSKDNLVSVNQFLLHSSFVVVIVVVGWMQARGSLLAFIVSVFVMFALSPSVKGAKKIAVIISMIIAAICVIINPLQNKYSSHLYKQMFDAPKIFIENNSDLTKYNLDEREENTLNDRNKILGSQACQSIRNSVTDRWLHYQTAIAVFLRYPYWGAGANKYGHFSCAGPGWYPHSTILQVLAELGVFITLVYALMLIFATRILLKRINSSKDLIAKSVYVFIAAYFVFHFITSQIYGNYFMSSGLYFALGIASRFSSDSSNVLR